MKSMTGARITFMQAAPVPGSDAVTLIKLVFQAADSMASATSDVLAELELTQSQARILWALDPGRPPVPMRELARRLHFDPSNITLMTDRLVTAGLVERRPHPTDGRQRVLALTDKGRKVLALLITRLQERSPIFALSPQELTQLARLLAKAQAGHSPPGATSLPG
jgi:MarR family transcriptional regulator, organic hydroperoxide resistance regulator